MHELVAVHHFEFLMWTPVKQVGVVLDTNDHILICKNYTTWTEGVSEISRNLDLAIVHTLQSMLWYLYFSISLGSTTFIWVSHRFLCFPPSDSSWSWGLRGPRHKRKFKSRSESMKLTTTPRMVERSCDSVAHFILLSPSKESKLDPLAILGSNKEWDI